MFSDDSMIDGFWTKLKEYRRKVKFANKNYTFAYPDKVLFHILTSALYKADKHVNLVSMKKLCKNGLKGSFNARSILFCSERIVVITANLKRGLYIVNHISKKSKDSIVQTMDRAVLAVIFFYEELTDIDPDDSEPELATNKAQRHWYSLLHHRFNHCGPGIQRKLHVVTSLQNQINIKSSYLSNL